MRTRLLIFFLMLFCFVSVGFGYKYETSVKRTFPIKPDGIVRLTTLRGNIEISTHSDSDITIKATIMSDDRSEIDKIKINFEAGADSVIVTSNGKLAKSKVDIDYYLKIPVNLKSLHVTTRSGEIEARGTYGNIDLNTTNGEIDFRGGFTGCKLNSANGDIDIYMKDTLKGDISAKSTNGSIEISLKSGSGFTIDGSSITGSIRSEFNTTIGRDLTGFKIKGTVESGTYKIVLRTVNGDLNLIR